MNKPLFSKQLTLIFTSLLFTLSQGIAIAEDFPLRAKYPSVKSITTVELNDNYESAIILDVRSKMEFDVAHINKAINLPVSKKSFSKDLEKARPKNDSTIIVTYCNGHTCAKSYKAVEIAMAEGFENVYVYDAGIFEWIMATPDKATLMGESPAPKEKIIAKTELNKKMLSWADFSAKSIESNTVTIDIRDPFQRKIIPTIKKLRNIPMDRLTKLLEQRKFADKQLLIIDAVGKQVRWLQYHLAENGFTNYYFLEEGIKGIN